jgi:hypothetical protein
VEPGDRRDGDAMNRTALQWVVLVLRSAEHWVEVDEDVDIRSRYMLTAFTQSIAECWREFHAAMCFQHRQRTGFPDDETSTP